MPISVPESRAVLSQGVQDGICDVGTARHTQRLQTVTTPANDDESLICDLLFTQRQSARLWGPVCDTICTIQFFTNIFKSYKTHNRVVAFWILLCPPCDYLFSEQNVSLSAQVYSSCFKEGTVLLNQSFSYFASVQLQNNAGLTEHVCKFSVTSSGQWAPICFRASSSSWAREWEQEKNG